jgi:hypothetical protein
MLRYYQLRRLSSNDSEWSRRQYPRDANTPWIRALNVAYVLDDAHISDVQNSLPRFYIQNHITPVDNEEQALTETRKPGFDPSMTAVVENVPTGWMPDATASGVAKIVEHRNNHLELEVQTSGRVFLVTSESFYPGWTATVNDQPVKILPTNVAFRGIPLNPGRSHVVMNYFPDKLVLSAVISLLGLGVVLCGLLLR